MSSAAHHVRTKDPMLAVGRLDGRLHHNPYADIFLARARLDGAAALAGLAGVPVRVQDLQDWITGRSLPPRASEGRNDPISVAAIFHVALTRDEDTPDPVSRATINTLRTILDDRNEAEMYGREDLAHFGPLWRQVRALADAPFTDGDMLAVAERIFELASMTEPALRAHDTVVTVDGRSFELAARGRDRNWLLATAIPRMLMRVGFTSRIIPSLVLLPKFLPPSPSKLASILTEEAGRVAIAGLRDLDAIERSASRMVETLSVTKRSKSPLLARLQLAYPGLQPSAVAKLLQVTPQGARKLLAGLRAPSRPISV
eukprot:TRINITY_DN11127_c0_g1_i18.p1 TRINITY_DN11127_c0_g1~~TRINITY_DN11127_c0_g1_i18.p1  ORF type:complete len:315 (-),score=22.12 TRINITY_DN11127_c0_g1_i18:341-1285(-)